MLGKPLMTGLGMMTGMLAMNLEVKTVPCQEILVRNIKYQIRRV